jgi:transcriptional regulator with XRE-family HTH domain
MSFASDLATIGWSARQLAERAGCGHNLAANWVQGAREAPAAVAEWVARLAEAVRALPAPKWREAGRNGDAF